MVQRFYVGCPLLCMQVSLMKERIPNPFKLSIEIFTLDINHTQPFGPIQPSPNTVISPVVLSTNECQGWWQIIPIIHVCQNGVDLFKLSDGTCKPQCVGKPNSWDIQSEHPAIHWIHGSMGELLVYGLIAPQLLNEQPRLSPSWNQSLKLDYCWKSAPPYLTHPKTPPPPHPPYPQQMANQAALVCGIRK